MIRRKDQRGVTLVEFALVAPLIFVFIFGLIDFSRIIQARTTVAEAARQAARQAAANADPADNPFASSPHAGACQGQEFTTNANGDGCLTDARMKETADSIVAAGALTRSLTLFASTDASTCLALPKPSPGSGNICIAPAEGGTANPAGSCPGGGAVLAVTTEGNRASEWGTHQYQGCFQIQVTVVYTYQPFTGLLQGLIGNRIVLSSTSTTIAEY